MLKNMKISTRMILSFALIILLSVTMVVMSISSLGTVGKAADDLYNRPFQVGRYIGEVKYNLSEVQKHLLWATVSTDPAEVEDLIKESDEHKAAASEAIGGLASIFEGDETSERTEMLNQIIAIAGATGEAKEEMLPLVRGMQNDAALKIFTQKYNPATEQIFELVSQLEVSAGINAENFMKNAQKEEANALRRIIINGVIQLLAAIFIAVSLTKGIVGPLKRMQSVAHSIASGEDDIHVGYKSKNELGELADAFRVVIDVLNRLNVEITSLRDWAKEGQVWKRLPDSDLIQGTYLGMVRGVESIVDALTAHLDSVPMPMVITNTEYQIQYGNKAALGMTGLEPDTLVGRKCFEVLPTSACNTDGCPGCQALKNCAGASVELQAGPMEINMFTNPFFDENGKPIGFLELAVDQTAMKHAQRESEKQAAAVAAQMKVEQKRAKFQAGAVDMLINSMRRLAKGDLDIVPPARREVDPDIKEVYENFHEIGEELGRSCVTIKGYISELTEVLEKLADKNLNIGIEREYVGDFKPLKQSINLIAENLNDVFEEITSATSQVQSGADQTSHASQILSQGTSDQASAIEEISATMTDVSRETKNNAANAIKANEMSLTAKADAEDGNKQMDEMVGAMDEIKEASKGIANIIKVIEDIAFQTNILALNAAVEAARAGEHGKGFAVVAEEVRTLAARSATAAKETTDMIDNSLDKVEIGAKIANDTASALGKIVAGVTDTVEIVGTIAEASEKQAVAISQIERGIEKISSATQGNASSAEESAAASEEMASQAVVLQGLVDSFSIKGSRRNAGIKSLPAPEKLFLN